MNAPAQRTFSLEPFGGIRRPPGLEIHCTIHRQETVLAVSWELSGNTAEIFVPPPARKPGRKDGLWKNTCFELFLARPGSPQYREFNLSPSGHWNAYRFDSYRRGMRKDETSSMPAVSIDRENGLRSISLGIELAEPATVELDAGITAVIKDKSAEFSYWALAHRGPRPDFHVRESFVARI